MSAVIPFPARATADAPAPLSPEATALVGAVDEIDALVIDMMARGIPPLALGLALGIVSGLHAHIERLPLDHLRDEADSMVAEVVG